jgi:hypothetical protein
MKIIFVLSASNSNGLETFQGELFVSDGIPNTDNEQCGGSDE